ncbi:hypothetical protein ACFQX6_25950 [Streptosporangium lutulentum]
MTSNDETTATTGGAALDGPTAWRALTPLMDLVTPMALRVAVTLRLPDLMDEDGSDIDDLAARASADPDALGGCCAIWSAAMCSSSPGPARSR